MPLILRPETGRCHCGQPLLGRRSDAAGHDNYYLSAQSEQQHGRISSLSQLERKQDRCPVQPGRRGTLRLAVARAAYPGLRRPPPARGAATDSSGNTDPTPASHTWAIDDVPPDTTITSAPPTATNSTSASFSFTSSEAGSTLQCSPRRRCLFGLYVTSRVLGPGRELAHVRSQAIDPAATSIRLRHALLPSTPRRPTRRSTRRLLFRRTHGRSLFSASEPGSTFECCSTVAAIRSYHPEELQRPGRSAATPSRCARSTRPGNADASPATSTWTVDTTAPNTTIGFRSCDPTNPRPSASFSRTSARAGLNVRMQARC